jgi:CheY-like chemotaxis protein
LADVTTIEDESRKRILIADDTVSSRELLRSILEGSGYDVFEAADGQEVLDWVADVNPDLIILDLNMPRLDGWATAAILRRVHAICQPIVALTATQSYAVQNQRAETYFSAYLVKPIGPTRLRKCIASLLAA